MIRVIRNESTCLCLTFLTELGVGGICLYLVLLVTASRLLDTLALLVILLLLFGGVAPDIFWVIVNLATFKLLCLRLEAVLWVRFGVKGFDIELVLILFKGLDFCHSMLRAVGFIAQARTLRWIVDRVMLRGIHLVSAFTKQRRHFEMILGSVICSWSTETTVAGVWIIRWTIVTEGDILASLIPHIQIIQTVIAIIACHHPLLHEESTVLRGFCTKGGHMPRRSKHLKMYFYWRFSFLIL